jgi:UDP-3-O-[3-hydroxymyristoyl] glucosamine N-acyltransferase
LKKPYSLSQLATYLDAELVGEPDYLIHGIATLQSADAGRISFVANPAYQKHLTTTRAGALIIGAQLAAEFAGNKLVVANPYLSYARLTGLFDTRPSSYQGIHPSSVVDSSAALGEGVSIGANAVIGAGVSLGTGVQIGAGTFIGEDSIIGAGTRLAANVTLYHGVVVGCDCIIHSGAVIGADGFGFAPQGRAWVKIHQLGGVVIGDRVEIGANTAVDRGALDNTVISDGVKLDNLVQIGHNVRIGKNTAIAADTAIAGSTVLGENCTISGCVGITGHLSLADNVHITAMSMVSSSIAQAGSYSSGTPIATTSEWRKNAARFRRLDNMAKRLKMLEKNQQK